MTMFQGNAGVAGVVDNPTQGNTPFEPNEYQPPPGKGKPRKADPNEEKVVREWWENWEDAREFDKNFREQVAVDRKYASGKADLTWAVSTNVIGAFIDVLTSLLYARDPDVSVTKAAQVDDTAPELLNGELLQPHMITLFARTLQIVISKQWKKAHLRRKCRKGVRSVLSTAEGWFKANMISEKEPNPVTETALNDVQETLKRLQAEEELLQDPSYSDPDLRAAEMERLQALQQELQAKVEVAVSRMLVIDFCRTETIQVSTDVEAIEDYLEAEWIGNETFMTKGKVLAQFPDLTEEDLASARLYYQQPPAKTSTNNTDNSIPQGKITAESALAFTPNPSSSDKRAFLHVIEIWDRVEKNVKTIVEGVKKWARLPYSPPYPTSRFYPYFYMSFYEVDGERHPQSLAWRLQKLQDEYSTARSNLRVTRERSIPGILVNGTALDSEQTRKLEKAKHQEFTVLIPTNPEQPIEQLFAPKPVAQIDMRVFDPTPITSDMERVSGVQEALSAVTQGPGNPQSATEASIQQQGTSARTTSDRDQLEWMLTDLAEYTAQQALQCLQTLDVQRMAGPKAFWPEGMTIDDLFTLVDVSIVAGSTGKPKAQIGQAEWAQVLPHLQQAIGDIQQAYASKNMPLATAIINLLKETMRRFGVEADLDQFIPQVPPPGSPGAGAPPPPIRPKVNVAIKGEITPQVAQTLVNPDLQQDQESMPPPQPGAPGAPPAGPGMPPTGPAPASPPTGPIAPPQP